jgi:hypothetical protein
MLRFSGLQDAAQEIMNLVRIIVNEFGGTRIFITADHAFSIHTVRFPKTARLARTAGTARM